MSQSPSKGTRVRPQNELEQIIGYRFQDRDLLTEALSHSSYYNERRGKGAKAFCNERLEFLGDAVLQLTVSRYVFDMFRNNAEGDLTKIRASSVCEKALAVYAKEIRLGEFLLLGKGEEKSGGRERPSVLSDAFEALLAAIYIDSGYRLENVASFVLPFAEKYIDQTEKSKHTFVDAKTALQQLIQESEGDLLEYVVVSEEGPDHDKHFEIEARLNNNVVGKGSGHSKREAEQAAAAEALLLFGEDGNSTSV
ncbi:MAG: ribonuclease III [Clostridia bacterium]|nr:ribonuclease III [Clostridia bacterium]